MRVRTGMKRTDRRSKKSRNGTSDDVPLSRSNATGAEGLSVTSSARTKHSFRADLHTEENSNVRVIVEYDVPDVDVIPKDELMQLVETLVRANTPLPWEVVNVDVQ